MQSGVSIRGNDKLSNRQSHLLGNITSVQGAKISSRDTESNLSFRRTELKSRIEIEGEVRKYANPMH